MKGFGLMVMSWTFLATMVNGLVNIPNLRKSRQSQTITVKQLETQIARLQKMLKELQSLEYRELHQKPSSSQFPRRNRLVRLVQPSNLNRSYQVNHPYNHYNRHFLPRDTKALNSNRLWYPYYSTQLRTPYYHSRYSM